MALIDPWLDIERGRCFICNEPMDVEHDGIQADHVVPGAARIPKHRSETGQNRLGIRGLARSLPLDELIRRRRSGNHGG